MDGVVLHNTYELPLSLSFLLAAVVALIQSGRIVVNKHKLFSYHFMFVVLALMWFLMRFTFFFFIGYWQFHIFVSLCIYWIPVGLQFSTFLLLIHYLASIYHKDSWEDHSRRIAWIWFCCANLVVYGSIGATLYVAFGSIRLQPLDEPPVPYWVDQSRALFSAIVFLVLIFLLLLYGLRVQRLLGDGKIPHLHISWLRFTLSLSLIIVIFLTRTVYGFVLFFKLDWALSFVPGNWVLDLAVCSILFFWEVVPTSLVLLLFWKIQSIPTKVAPVPYALADNHPARSSYFYSNPALSTSHLFDNPNRYDSDFEADADPDATTSLFPNTPTNSEGGRGGGGGMFGHSGYGSYSSAFSPYRTYSPLNSINSPVNVQDDDDSGSEADRILSEASYKTRRFRSAHIKKQTRLFE